MTLEWGYDGNGRDYKAYQRLLYVPESLEVEGESPAEDGFRVSFNAFLIKASTVKADCAHASADSILYLSDYHGSPRASLLPGWYHFVLISNTADHRFLLKTQGEPTLNMVGSGSDPFADATVFYEFDYDPGRAPRVMNASETISRDQWFSWAWHEAGTTGVVTSIPRAEGSFEHKVTINDSCASDTRTGEIHGASSSTLMVSAAGTAREVSITGYYAATVPIATSGYELLYAFVLEADSIKGIE